MQNGFHAWRRFNERFGEEQRRIRQLNPGLAGWGDVYSLLTEYGDAKPADGYAAMRFAAVGDEVEYAPDLARVVQTDDGKVLACGDYSGSPVYGSSGQIAEPAGLNVGPVQSVLRKLAFPAGVVGPAQLRWPAGVNLPEGFPPPLWGVLVLLRQTARMDALAGWIEQGYGLHCFRVSEAGVAHPVEGQAKGQLLRGLFAATVRTKPEDAPALTAAIAGSERELIKELRRPSEADGQNRVRHAVYPLLAAIVAEAG